MYWKAKSREDNVLETNMVVFRVISSWREIHNAMEEIDKKSPTAA